MNEELTTLDFLRSEYEWCMSQYKLLGYESYLARAKAVEEKMAFYLELEAYSEAA